MHLLGIETVVFDFDGTLATCPYDFAKMRRAILAAATEHGIDEVVLEGHGLLECIDIGAQVLGEDQLRSAAFREDAMARLTAIEFEAAVLTRLLPGVVEGLQRLRAHGFKLGIVTRNSAAAVALIIGDAPLPFDAMLCREHVEIPKPHPSHVLEMLRLLDSTPELALMVGDHPMDIDMGHDAGMRTVAVLTGQSSADDLQSADPDLLLPSVVELVGILTSRADKSVG